MIFLYCCEKIEKGNEIMKNQNTNDFANLSQPEQKKLNPIIEDIIPKFLNDDVKKNALDFVAYLRADKLKLVWHSMNTWKVNYKSEPLTFIKLCVEGDECGRPGNLPSWIIIPCLNYIHEYEMIIIDERLQNLICDNKYYCVNDSINGQLLNHCNPNKRCAGGVNRTIFDKDFKGLCNCRPHP